MIEILNKKYRVKDLQSKMKDLLDRGHPFTQSQRKFLTAVFERHPNKDKIKKADRSDGLMNLIVRKGAFHFKTQAGSYEDISYKQCIKKVPKQKSDKDHFVEACRNVIRYDINIIREEALNGKTQCPMTGEKLTPANIKIHHDGTLQFKEIVEGFLDENKIDLKSVLYETGRGKAFKSRRLLHLFRSYHNQRATLTAVSDEGHKILHQKKNRKIMLKPTRIDRMK